MTGLLFTEEEWDEASKHVVRSMTEYLKVYRAPVFEHLGDHGRGWGSGSYLQLGDQTFILTNEHVARARTEGRQLIYQLHGQTDLKRVVGNHLEHVWPLDLALLPVDPAAWADGSNQSRAITPDQVWWAHRAVEGELFTFVGFSGEEAKFHFGTLFSTATCFTSKEVELPADDTRFDSRYHFGLVYPPDLAKPVISDKGLPLPPGFSGSTLWNTRLVEAKMGGQPWTPDLAVVTGVIWGWPSSAACLVVTRAEYLRSFLLGASALVAAAGATEKPNAAPVDPPPE